MNPQGARNAEPFDATINGFSTKNRDSSAIWSKVVGGKVTAAEGRNIYASRRVNFGSNYIFTKGPKFVDLGLSSFDTIDESGSVFTKTSTVIRPPDSYY